ncbi:peptidase [Campylobacterota bacterium]|nr:peptidase [Campylobacterota bacterium]
MRDKTTIIISDVHGSVSYTITNTVKQVILYSLGAFAALVLVGVILIYVLADELQNFDRLKERHRALLLSSHSSAQYSDENGSLTDDDKNSSGVQEAEGFAFVPFARKIESNDVESQIDAARISAVERMLMLRLMPSGMPIEYRGLTSNYGWRYHPLRRTQREFHTGSDLRAAIGTPVYATADSVVEVTRSNPAVGFGNVITLSHNFGFKTIYGHLSKILVKQGDFVKKGQLIAYSGNSGYSNGPHLHYEIRYLGKPLDPSPFLEWDMRSYEAIFDKEKIVQWDSVVKGVAWQRTLLEQLSLQKEPKLPAPSKLSANSISTDK